MQTSLDELIDLVDKPQSLDLAGLSRFLKLNPTIVQRMIEVYELEPNNQNGEEPQYSPVGAAMLWMTKYGKSVEELTEYLQTEEAGRAKNNTYAEPVQVIQPQPEPVDKKKPNGRKSRPAKDPKYAGQYGALLELRDVTGNGLRSDATCAAMAKYFQRSGVESSHPKEGTPEYFLHNALKRAGKGMMPSAIASTFNRFHDEKHETHPTLKTIAREVTQDILKEVTDYLAEHPQPDSE